MPLSRGKLRLASTAPGLSPIIDPQYYTERRDLQAMAAGLEAARDIGSAAALKPWCAAESWPGSQVADNELGRHVPFNLRSYSHYGGSCKMGSDATSVVDSQLRVNGIAGLCVADASVMPGPVSANTNATVYAIAERAAELIRWPRGREVQQ
jgi:choline dehydrogenase